ncbi:uncharacterized protein [Dermacentor albipictus]|uniref:uncharacterized protein n=1 Tax=Dermacentor albipictus TaxID=60249 RepID=UPI0031FBCA4F
MITQRGRAPVESAFRNLSVNIRITFEGISQNNNLSVPLEESNGKLLDRQRTLQKVKDYGKPLADKNRKIYYLFVSHPLGGNTSRSYSIDADTVVSTNGTFCTNESNAAVVRHSFNNSNFYWRAAKSTAYILGAKPISFFVSLKPEDLTEVNNTISHCLKSHPEENQAPGYQYVTEKHTEVEDGAGTVEAC